MQIIICLILCHLLIILLIINQKEITIKNQVRTEKTIA